MKIRRTHAFVIALGVTGSQMPCYQAHAELVQAHLEGIVNSSPIAGLNGQPWALTIVFDTAAPEAPFSAGSPMFAEFFNTGPVKVLRTLDFSVGNSGAFTIHLVDPVPVNEFDVRIDIDNFNTKTFFNALVQYNSDTRQWTSNLRFNVIHRPLSDFFFVYNERRDERTGQMINRALIAKFTYLLAF